MIVVDTMVVAYGLLPHPHFADEVEGVRAKDGDWAAPSVWRSELRNVLLQYVRAVESGPLAEDLQLGDAFGVMEDAEALLADQTYRVNSEEVMRTALESGCSAYDCEYVALAQRLGVWLVTYDDEVLDAFPDTALHPSEFLSMHGD
jgi:predicted nucleic acid-binding protein